MKTTIVFSLCLLLTLTGLAQRNIISLNGIWDVEESIEATKMPKKFSHQVEVPGMINQSKPAFDDIDDFYSKEYCTNPIVRPGMKKVPISIDSMKVGYNFQKRNYFWYRRGYLIEGTARQSFIYGDGLRHDEHLHARLASDDVATFELLG